MTAYVIVDIEVTVGAKWNTSCVRIAFNKAGVFTNQGGKHALSRRSPRIIAAGQNQDFAFDVNVPVCHHFGVEIVYHPELTGWVDAANDVPSHIRKTPIGILRTGYIRDGVDSDTPFEFYQDALIAGSDG